MINEQIVTEVEQLVQRWNDYAQTHLPSDCKRELRNMIVALLDEKTKKMRDCLLALKITKHEESPCDELGSHMPWLCDVCKKIDEALK